MNSAELGDHSGLAHAFRTCPSSVPPIVETELTFTVGYKHMSKPVTDPRIDSGSRDAGVPVLFLDFVGLG